MTKSNSYANAMVTVQINVDGFQPRLDASTGRLTLTVPGYPGNILNPDALNGLSEQNAMLLEGALHDTYLRTTIGLILSQQVVTDR